MLRQKTAAGVSNFRASLYLGCSLKGNFSALHNARSSSAVRAIRIGSSLNQIGSSLNQSAALCGQPCPPWLPLHSAAGNVEAMAPLVKRLSRNFAYKTTWSYIRHFWSGYKIIYEIFTRPLFAERRTTASLSAVFFMPSQVTCRSSTCIFYQLTLDSFLSLDVCWS